VPVKGELIVRLDGLARRSFACWMRAQEGRRTELRAAMRALPSADQLLAIPRQRLDACADRLPRALAANAHIHHMALSRIASRLTPQSMRTYLERRRDRFEGVVTLLATVLRGRRAQIEQSRERINTLFRRAERAAAALVHLRHVHLERWGQLLAAFSYHGVLARGFALVRDVQDKPLRAAAAVSPGMHLKIEFADGHVPAIAGTGDIRAPVVSPNKPKKGSGGGGQGSLFD
jgi:exodeoxyribonuclease VII large subunit